MTADKRSTHTDALETLGKRIGDTEKRDAIHLAVEPVVAGELLRAGEHITLRDGVAYRVAPNDGLGIVDPFIDGLIDRDERFWLVVYPRQITSLRHVWEHPAFPASGETGHIAPSKAASEAWLRNFIAGADCPDYEQVIAKALNNDSWSPEYLHFDGSDAHGDIPPVFWDHVEVVTGKQIPEGERAAYFSCSC